MNATEKNYTQTIPLKNALPQKVFSALTVGIPNWWTEMFEGNSEMENSVFTIRFGEQVFKTMRVETLVTDEKVVWEVMDALIDFPELNNKYEWIGTRIEWKIIRRENDVELQLIHFGLTPEIECFTMCEAGWRSFTQSLSNYIQTGMGSPFQLK